ncbi:alpha/beta hydrolase [Desulfosporosinus sp.]|uniref:alpha/beta hydrolase n=1 Tax=Desulfosporosinus sp. TaxID=157907 RepID=UPI0025B9048A|nr:alpha/beta hydrolase [Desulfosporosinus sp.]MBC2724842.1 alpha/beta hydrolase [Desulfosporosinus sp.]MBC2725530.1 alpha/beta hydrolase [Desulfosporosinus sp.]
MTTIKTISVKSFGRRVARSMLIIPAVLLVCMFILVGVLLASSPGKVEPFLDENGRPLAGSISEKIFVNINGVEQGMFIKGKDKTKPVILFLHGGPGMPEYAVSRKYPLVLENDFTVCWWEQRGAGLSYSSDILPETMTFEQLISDTLEVTNYLRKRFGQEKIYLMGHSGGSFIGIQAAARAPEFYKAYIAVAQISNQLESEKLAYNYMIEQFSRLGDKSMLQKFEKYSINEINLPSYYTMRDAPMHKLGIGTTHNMKSVISGVFLPIMLHNEYTLSEKINIWRGKFLTTKTYDLWRKLVATDLTKKVQGLHIPVYFIHGIYDYTVSYSLAQDYFEELQAPIKGFYTFELSAHSPLFEEPEKMQQILQEDVLVGVNNLADIK